MSDERRQRGLEVLTQLYGEDRGYAKLLEGEIPPESAPHAAETIDHLFAEVWTRPGLSMKDRRMLCLGVIAAQGRADLAEVQIYGALKNDELTREEIGEVALQLAYYAGWPNASAFNRGIRAAIERFDREHA